MNTAMFPLVMILSAGTLPAASAPEAVTAPTAQTKTVKSPAQVRRAELPREWVWQRKAVKLDDMFMDR
ncbi:MAG: hypothetical protein AAFN74_15625 [Myxococcota bacterium]